ncbi:MAG: DUF465 domain-containing protein [Gammaproteobacteria bacterium]|nr:DUF465 domain-containing protein [Gammaproteobacteria bacterium]
MNDNVETNTFQKREQLKELRCAHRELDHEIDELTGDPDVDQLLIKRLKKRKLLLKDMIVKLESALIPNLNA